jgi:TRAP-type C4-dicarboxylate transport system substrate-binding protein
MILRRPGLAFAVAVTLAALMVGTAGCTGSGAKGSKAGAATAPIVLHLATVESTAPYIPDVQRFASEVAKITNGSIIIQIDLGGAGDYAPSTEQTLTAMVKDGRTDLGLVPPRVFDTVGIHGFEALQTPFLIDSPELAGAITTGDVATSLLTGLSDDGLVGLGLWYDSLRRPLAIQGALTAAAQIDGLTVRVAISGVGWDMFKAFGAVPDLATSHTISTSGDPYPLVETDLELAQMDFPEGSVTANMVFYPKYNALLANPDAFGHLTKTQQDALRQAARDTAKAAVATTTDDEALAQTFCEGGGHLLIAPPEEVAKLQKAAAPVIDRLRADDTARTVIGQIESLKGTVAAPPYHLAPACAPPTGDGAKLPTTPPPPSG